MTLECKKLVSTLNRCVFQHQKRESNSCPDILFAPGHDSSEAVQYFEHHSHQIVPQIIAYYKGFFLQRGVNLTDFDILKICTRIPFSQIIYCRFLCSL